MLLIIMEKNFIYKDIESSLALLDVTAISAQQKQAVQPLIAYIREKREINEAVRLTFICTHNSRRSHFSQVWAQTLAYYFKIENVFCYSGGTEATALFGQVATTLEHSGFKISRLSEEENPVYSIKFNDNEPAIVGFSKVYDHPFNPVSDFAAILTCSQADEGCPFIAGAEKRFPVTFEDPKTFDGTAQQTQKYNEKSNEIATLLYYVFSQIKTS